MNIFKNILSLFRGCDNLITQVGIFALTGILVVALNGVLSLFLGYSLYSVFAVPSNGEIIIYALIAMTVSIFFTGYYYRYVNSLHKDVNSNLPTLSMNCFTAFVSILPIALVWSAYILVLATIPSFLSGFLNIGIPTDITNIYLIFLILLIPFVHLIFVTFAKDFDYRMKYISPKFLFNIFGKTFNITLSYTFVYILLTLLNFVFFGFILKQTELAGGRNVQLILILICLCSGGYIQQLLNLALFKGYTKISKEKII